MTFFELLSLAWLFFFVSFRPLAFTPICKCSVLFDFLSSELLKERKCSTSLCLVDDYY